MNHLRQAVAAFAVLMTTALPALADLTLLMVEQRGCSYCRLWNEQIAPIYPKTTEGKIAPLRRMDLRAGTPADITLKSRPAFTPTFVLLRDGTEINRLEGYPGEDFFWGLIARMLESEPEWAASSGG